MKQIAIFMVSLFVALHIGFSFAAAASYNQETYQAQKLLKELGYNPGKLDGLWGKATQMAVERFQRDSGLPVTGRLDEETKARLEIRHSERGIKVSPQVKEPRIALVIGNSAYRSSPLRNPVNDAEAIAEILKECGFEVTVGLNLNQTRMKRAIDSFGRRIVPGSVALFYYAGHGMQVNGENYLIPIGANIGHEEDVDVESVKVNRLLAKMASVTSTVNILILDACRDNPFSRGFRSKLNGLAYMSAPRGTIIAYSTAPSSIAIDGEGKHSVYTESLIDFLLVPDMKIEDIFKRVRVKVTVKTNNKQVPWESSSLMGDFYFTTRHIAPPLASHFSLEDLSREADRKETIKRAWDGYLARMKTSYRELNEFFERNLSSEEKVEALERFLDTYSKNNPYSQEDNRMREDTRKQIAFWTNYKPKPVIPTSAFITIGTHKDDVIRIQGTPSTIIDGFRDYSWYYGSSSIQLSKQDNRVIRWSNAGNLKVKMQ